MKRQGYLYDQILEDKNLNLAITKAAQHKKDRAVVRKAINHRDILIHNMKENLEYTGIYREMDKYDPASGKTRRIVVPDFPYLIRQHAIAQIVYPIITKGFYKHSYGAIGGKGTLKASNALRSAIKNDRKNTKWFVQLDIRKYYDNIDVKTLEAKIAKKIKDKKVLQAINKTLDKREKGICIGNYLSQILSNFYLTDFDHYVKEQLKVKHYFRLVDDMVLLSANKRHLERAIESIKGYLLSLGLTLHEERIKITRLTDNTFIDFCGYKHYGNGKVAIRKRNFRRLRHTVCKLVKNTYRKLVRRFMSYWGFVKHSNSHKFYEEYMPLINMANMRQLVSCH